MVAAPRFVGGDVEEFDPVRRVLLQEPADLGLLFGVPHIDAHDL